jgi:hypothetical protein
VVDAGGLTGGPVKPEPAARAAPQARPAQLLLLLLLLLLLAGPGGLG